MNKPKIRIIHSIGLKKTQHSPPLFVWFIRMANIEDLINSIKTCPELYQIIII